MNTKTIELSYEELEEAIIPYLIASGKLQDDEETEYFMDMAVPLNENGMIELDIEEIDWEMAAIEADRELTEEMRAQAT